MGSPFISVTFSAPGRICLAGESLDWMIKGPSIVASIPLRTFVSINQQENTRPILSICCLEPFNCSKDIPLQSLGRPSGDMFDHVQLATHMISQLSGQIANVSITIRSTIPANAGVSSSAAVTLAVIGALNAYWQVGLTTNEICSLAFRVESEKLKTGAGQMDFYACGIGGLLSIKSSIPPSITRYRYAPDNLRIVLVDTKTPHGTKMFISSKRKRFQDKDPLIDLYIAGASTQIINMDKLLMETNPDPRKIGNCITACHTLLKEYLDSSTELLETCVSRCLSNGAYGAKLTGSGLGGCMFALTNKESIPSIKTALVSLPVQMYDFPFTHEGIRLEQTI